MREGNLVSSVFFGEKNWCLELKPLYKHGLLSSLSNGVVNLLDWETVQVARELKVGNVAINKMRVIDGNFSSGSCFAAASIEGVKVFDVRSSEQDGLVAEIHNAGNVPYLSVDARHGMLACGMELSGVDAELHLYDLRAIETPMRSFIDSHHDDVTDIKFHPNDPNVLMSGSTDGYTNIYDLTQEEEEDALHQVVNYDSIHSCGWLSPRRIFTLTHMETFAIHELNNKLDELTEPCPTDFGDIRQAWDCSYVVDVYPGYIATGKSQENASELKLISFNNENVETNNTITIANAHNNEIVRDVYIPTAATSHMYSCGEDGNVRIWDIAGFTSLGITDQFFDYSKLLNALEANDEDGNTAIPDLPSESTIETSTKRKHHKKSKDKHSKSKKSSKTRFKPY